MAGKKLAYRYPQQESHPKQKQVPVNESPSPLSYDD
jgi:hypothetical protein